MNRESPLPMEFLNPPKGKMLLDPRTTRALQSKISLKFPLAAVVHEKPKMKPTIKQSIIDNFEIAYANNCDKDRQRSKNRNVSFDSPFDPKNKPPRQYIEDDIILEKPCKIKINEVAMSKDPLAGKMTNIGHEIIRLGSYKAKHLVTGNWDFKYPKGDGKLSTVSSANSRRTGNIKVTSYNPHDYKPSKETHNILM